VEGGTLSKRQRNVYTSQPRRTQFDNETTIAISLALASKKTREEMHDAGTDTESGVE